MNRIPKILHYCFGMAEDFGGKPWALSHYACVRSAVDKIRPDETYLYYEYEPTGPWWELTKKIVTPVKITAPRSIFGNPVDHPAHRADVVRLQALIEKGGIYLDADVFVHKSFDELLKHSVVLGAEGRGATFGTANAVILAEPKAKFLERWYGEYKTFRGNGRQHWNEHSVRLPLYLSKKHPEEITILDYRAFFWPLWHLDHLQWIFHSTKLATTPQTYATHLWDGKSYRYTKDLTPGDVRKVDTNFHRWVRPYVEGLADDLGRTGSSVEWRNRVPDIGELWKDRATRVGRFARSKLLPPRRFEV